MAPIWGADTSPVEQMWGSADVLRAHTEPDTTPSLSPAQVEFDGGYGLVTHEGAGLLATYGGPSLAGPHSNGVRLGGRIVLGEWEDLSVEGERTTRGGVTTKSPSTAPSAGSPPLSSSEGRKIFLHSRFNTTVPGPIPPDYDRPALARSRREGREGVGNQRQSSSLLPRARLVACGP